MKPKGTGYNNKYNMKKHIIKIASIIVGGLLGFLYWYYIGCQSGTCPIKSKWYLSLIFGSIIGYLTLDLIQDFLKKKKNEKENIKIN